MRLLPAKALPFGLRWATPLGPARAYRILGASSVWACPASQVATSPTRLLSSGKSAPSTNSIATCHQILCLPGASPCRCRASIDTTLCRSQSQPASHGRNNKSARHSTSQDPVATSLGSISPVRLERLTRGMKVARLPSFRPTRQPSTPPALAFSRKPQRQ